MGKFDESKHPRNKAGKFESKSIDEGIITHDNKIYNVNRILKLAKKEKVYQQPLSQLKETLQEPLTKTDRIRIKKVSNYLHIPIVIAKTKDRKSGIVNIDGFHRIHRANELGLTHLPAVKLSNKKLKQARITKYHILKASLAINKGKYGILKYSNINNINVNESTK